MSIKINPNQIATVTTHEGQLLCYEAAGPIFGPEFADILRDIRKNGKRKEAGAKKTVTFEISCAAFNYLKSLPLPEDQQQPQK